ncbi:MAG: lipoyl(octanoyl) transferase LipB [Candidatus Omnitrophota bacterium]
MKIIDIGLKKYREAYEFQLELVEKVSRGLEPDTLIITEHYPIITLGRRSKLENILASEEELNNLGIEVLKIDRGGDVTYHGPGQLVAYPIMKLENEAKDIHIFLDYLEEVGLDFLSRYNVSGSKKSGYRGVWVGEQKIASIGIGVKKWVTYHGIAININTRLKDFSLITPCGIKDIGMTSLEKVLGKRIDIDHAKDRLVSSFKEVSLLAKADAYK